MNFGEAITLSEWIGSLILLAGVVDDFRSRKFHNWLFLCCSVVAVACAIWLYGWLGLEQGALGFVTAVVVMLPLVLLRVVGAGDLKLLAAFGWISTYNAVLYVAGFSIVWGAVFGVLSAVFSGAGRKLYENMLSLALHRDSKGLELQKIPFTVALLIGWLTYLKYSGAV